MKKFGTPIGAAPGTAIDVEGFVSAGRPLGSRRRVPPGTIDSATRRARSPRSRALRPSRVARPVVSWAVAWPPAAGSLEGLDELEPPEPPSLEPPSFEPLPESPPWSDGWGDGAGAGAGAGAGVVG